MSAAPTIDARPTLLERIARARQETDKLFALVKPDALYERPIAERNRIVFYLGHLEAFDWNLLQPRLAGLTTFDTSLDKLFAFGIDPVNGGLPSDGPGDWPSESQVSSYNRRVRTALDEALPSSRKWCGNESREVLLNVAIEHRLMHAETLAYMLHQLPLASKIAEAQPSVPGRGPAARRTIRIPAGPATLGLPRGEDEAFGWDNEFERHVVDVPPFAIDRYKVTNGQFLDFVKAGGYRDRSLWTEADWHWRKQHGIEHPAFWKRHGAEFRYRAMFEEIALPLDWPVYVSHAEARAYAAWAGKRLPTEAEWHRAAYGPAHADAGRAYPWGGEAPGPRHGYFDMQRWDPAPVNACPQGRSHWGVDGMLANGWEWTSQVFEPFRGFRSWPFYPGYSADFFDGLHYVLKGGSPRTERSMLRPSFRNWFQPHYQYVYAGFRCASGDPDRED